MSDIEQKINNLKNEITILENMTDEDYINQSYNIYLLDTYVFLTIYLDVYGFTVESMSRQIAIALLKNCLLIKAVSLY